MAKSSAYKTALVEDSSPAIFRKAYLFKRIDEDANGKISSFHDINTMYKAVYDHDKLGIFSDLHYSEWDHTYGTENCQLTITPDSASLLSQAWTRTPSSGGAATQIATIGSGGTHSSGTFLIECTSSQTITYHKTDVIDTVSSSTSDSLGSFTAEFEYRKGVSESSNNNPFKFQIKCGTFHVLLTLNRLSFSFEEVGGSSTTVTPFLLQDDSWGINTDGRGSYESGQTTVFRIIIDKKRASKKAVLLVDGQEMASVNHTVDNTTGNEVKFGYFSSPTSTSQSFIGYVRFHNSSFFPIETYRYRYCANGQLDSSTNTHSTRRFTKAGGASSQGMTGLSTFPNRASMFIDHTSTTTDSTFTRTDTSDFNSNAVGNAVEFIAELRNSGGTAGLANGDMRFTINDGTRSNQIQLLGSSTGSIVVNPGGSAVTLSGLSPISVFGIDAHRIRMVVKGTNTYVYVNDVQYDGVTGSPGTTPFTNSSATATTSFEILTKQSSGTDFNNYRLHDIKWFKRPAHPTRLKNQASVAILDEVTLSTFTYDSDVVVNDATSLISPPLLPTLVGINRDLCYGDSGFTAMSAMKYRSSNTSFLAADVSPSFTAITPSTDFVKRDYFTTFATTYFQIRTELSAYEHELIFMRFHRQLDVSDYVTSWGSSSFSRDPITKALDAGNLSVTLMNPDGDFNLFRDSPELWVDAYYEVWIGVTVSGTDHMYPDFVGIIQDMAFDETDMRVNLQVTNIVKFYKDFDIGTQFGQAPYNQLKIYAGSTTSKVSVRQDPDNVLIFYVDSKYPIIVTNVYVDGQLKVLNTDYRLVNTGGVNIRFITTSVGGTVTVDIAPKNKLGTTNANDIMRFMLQKEAKLLPNFDIDDASFDSVDTFVSAVQIGNITISNIKLLDWLETVCNQVGCTLYLKDDSNTQLSIEKTNIVHNTYELITYNGISNTIGQCTNFSKRHPVEHVITVVDIKFDSDDKKQFFTYTNTNTVGDYDASSSKKNRTIVNIFGKKRATKLVSNSTGKASTLQVDYPFLTRIADVNNTSEINFDLFGNRPALYDISNVHLNIFNYSLQTVLEFHRDTATEISDYILITRIDKDYDNLTGSLQGISNVFREVPGGINFVFGFATDAGTGTIDVDYWAAVNSAPTDITGITKANPAVVTAPGHTFENGDLVIITDVLGMTEINNTESTAYTVAGKTSTTFQLSGINSTSFSTYTSGGTVEDKDTCYARA